MYPGVCRGFVCAYTGHIHQITPSTQQHDKAMFNVTTTVGFKSWSDLNTEMFFTPTVMSNERWGTYVRAPDSPSRGLGSKCVVCLELTKSLSVLNSLTLQEETLSLFKKLKLDINSLCNVIKSSSRLVQEIIMNNQPLWKGLRSSNEVSEGRTPHV